MDRKDRPLTREDMLRMANRTGKTGYVFLPDDGSWPRTSDVHRIPCVAEDGDEAEGPEGE